MITAVVLVAIVSPSTVFCELQFQKSNCVVIALDSEYFF